MTSLEKQFALLTVKQFVCLVRPLTLDERGGRIIYSWNLAYVNWQLKETASDGIEWD